MTETQTPVETSTDDAAASAAAAAAAATAAAEAAAATAAAEQKAKDDAAAAAAAVVVPEKYDLKLPADSAIDPAIIERTAATARELGLSNEAGQKLLDTVVAEFTASQAALVSQWEPKKGPAWIERNEAWKAQALADKEIGGTPEKLEESTRLANTVVEKFFDKKILEFLTVSGLASHPEYVRGLARIGRGMSEGSLVLGSQGTAAKPKTAAEILYGEDGMGPKHTTTKE